MAALSERKLEIVRTLVETAPDPVVDGLHQALAGASGDTALASVRRLVEDEVRDRQLRNIVLLPIAPMCVGDGRDTLRLTFPGRVLGLIWRGLKVQAPAVVHNAELALYDYRPGETSTEQFDRLVKLAAKGVRAGEQREFRSVAELCDEARPAGAASLLACLDLSPVVRGVAHRLPAWTGQQGGGANVGARLAYKDAVAVSDDAGPRFFQMLAAQLQHPWMIMRIISAVMEKPTERYLAETELGMFGQSILQDIEDALTAVAEFDLDGGPPAATAAARLVDQVTMQANDLETYVTLSRDHGWGAALVKHRKSLASIVEGRFREAEKQFDLALPCGSSKVKRLRRSTPKLDAAPDEAAVARCGTLLLFAGEVRFSSNYGGFASARSKLLEGLGEQLDQYVDEVLELHKAGEAPSEAAARTFLSIAADFNRLVRDEKAAELVRRRVAVAFAAPAADPVKSLIANS
ncbi:MAG TPA: hypothetical protein VJS38_16310 [Phenylobacterium sp.]|uniref:hypothetical protein n=1 Tax=Phenylobacterium sp. TaxID=1871053 RepID=UPI002B488438|nr:hypothetical protein [Phenylobacterium sp.]HKR89735.1 hypothetical protein [Phenylobacterium sp.]